MDSEKLKQLQIASEAKGRSRTSFWLITILILLATGVTAFLAIPKSGDDRRLPGDTQTAPATHTSVPTTAEPPRTGSNDVVLTVSGYIINRERIELSPRFMGLVKWIGVKKGDAVTNGQVVVLLDDAEQAARLAEAQARHTNAQVNLAKANLDYERARQLQEQNIETQQAADDARLRRDAARAAVQEAAAAVAVARTYLDWTVIRAPIDGVVLEKLVDPNELVTPQSFGGTRGPSTALIALANPKDLQVEIDLNEADVGKVFLNQRCRVSPEAYPEKVYDGYVAEMAPEANRQKGTLQIKVQIQNPDQFLTPELTGKVDFLAGKPEE